MERNDCKILLSAGDDATTRALKALNSSRKSFFPCKKKVGSRGDEKRYPADLCKHCTVQFAS